jgi:hypothetical protein
MLDIQLISSPDLVPPEISSKLELRIPFYLYLLYQDKTLVAWAQVLFHNAEEHEIASVEVKPEYRYQGYGSRLIQFLLHHSDHPRLMLTTLEPEFYLKQGFHRLTTFPSFVNHTDPACQQCDPSRCNILAYDKPEGLERLRMDSSLFSEYRRVLKFSQPMICEYSWVNNLIWSFSENPHLLKIDDWIFVVVFPFESDPYGALLPYAEIPHAVMDETLARLKKLGISKLKFLTSRTQRHLKGFEISQCEDRSNFDYLYKTDDFAHYSGSPFEKKRNRMKKFLKVFPGHRLEPYLPHHRDAVLRFANDYFQQELKLPEMSSLSPLKTALHHEWTEGLLVWDNDELAGALFYSELNPHTAVVHFEIVKEQYDGLSALLNHELGKQLQGRTRFINREQDLGLPGLRKSKLSYRPYRILKKYEASI